MKRTGFGRAVAAVLAAAMVMAACGGDEESSEPTVPDVVDELPDEWAPAAIDRMEALAADLAAAEPPMCADLGVMKVSDYAIGLTYLQTATEIPETIGSCTGGDENLELVVFADAQRRDAFIEERRSIICRLATNRKVDLPGLRFAVGEDWSIQTDTQTVALDIIDVLGGEYRMEACGEVEDPDWDPASVDRIRALAARLDESGRACDFLVDDKDLLRTERHYQDIGLPGALGSCEADFGPTLPPTFGLAGFSDDTTPADEFIAGELAELCSAGADVRVVRGEGWAAFVVGPAVAEIVATALDGTALPPDCPTPVATSTTPSTVAEAPTSTTVAP
jgi:hypothetical protein